MAFAVKYKKPKKNKAIAAVIHKSPIISLDNLVVFLLFSLINIIPPSPSSFDISWISGIILQFLSDIINQTVDRMVRIVQCPSTKQNLLQMFPADSLFSAMEKQLQYLCKLRLFFLLCDQRSPLIFQGKITEHFYIQNLLFLRYFVLHTRSTCLHTFVCSLLRQPLS